MMPRAEYQRAISKSPGKRPGNSNIKHIMCTYIYTLYIYIYTHVRYDKMTNSLNLLNLFKVDKMRLEHVFHTVSHFFICTREDFLCLHSRKSICQCFEGVELFEVRM